MTRWLAAAILFCCGPAHGGALIVATERRPAQSVPLDTVVSAWIDSEGESHAVESPLDLLEVEYGAMQFGSVELVSGTTKHQMASGSWYWLPIPSELAADGRLRETVLLPPESVSAACDIASDQTLEISAGSRGSLYWRCALTHLRAGRQDKSDAAFANAVAFAPEHALWLNIAYRIEGRRAGAPVQGLRTALDALVHDSQSSAVAKDVVQLERARALQRELKLGEASAQLADLRSRRTGDHLLNMVATMVHAQTLRDLNRVEEAHAAFVDLLEMARKLPPSLEVAGALMSAGLWQRTRGDYAEAERTMLDALAVYRQTDPFGLQTASLLFNISPLYLDRGELTKADEALREALAIQLKVSSTGRYAKNTYIAMAALAVERNELDEALQNILRAIELLSAEPASPNLAAAYSQLGIVHSKRGSLSDAVSAFTESDRLFRQTTPGTMIHTWTLQLGASARQSLGQIESARADLERVVAMREKIAPDGLDLAKGRQALADLALANNDVDVAAKMLDAAVPVIERNAPHSSYLAHAINSQGRIARRLGQTDKARELFCRAVDIVEQQKMRISPLAERRARYSAEQRALYDDCTLARAQDGDLSRAFDVIERYRARGLIELMSDRALLLDNDLTPALRSERDRLERALARTPGDAQLQSAQDQLIGRIRAQAPRYAALRYPEPLSLRVASRQLPRKSAAVVYLLSGDRLHALVVRGDREPSFVDLGPGRDAIAAVAALRSSTDTASLRRTFAVLMAPLETAIAGAERLILAPDDVLHQVPFAALQDTHGRYLIERFSLKQVPSLSLLAELQRRRSANDGIVATADPMADGGQRPAVLRGNLAPLPNARREVDAIARIFGGRTAVIVGEAANESAVMAAARNARVVHLAVHGFFDSKFPARSGLVLAPSANDDGIVNVADVAQRWQLDADLVVLSACESAAGEISASEGVIGLVRAFHYAGARTVLGSLWAVPDRSTADLMVVFHRLQQRGFDAADALRHAQLAMIGRPALSADTLRGVGAVAATKSSPSIQAWAAFVVHGG